MQPLLKRIESVPGECTLKHELSSSSISKVFLCILNNTKAVIRFDLPTASKLAVDRNNELNLLKSITHLDLAPKILYSDQAAGILIWKYIPGAEPIFNQPHLNQHSLRALGSCLYSIHSMPIPQNSIDIFSNSISLYQGLLDSPSDKLLFNKSLNLYNELVNDGVSQVFSHNDLHRSNLLWNEKYYFLDWEYSSLNHPCFDIASLVRTFHLNQDQIDDLSIGYKYNREIFDLNVMNQWIKFIEYLNKIWEISVTKIQENLAYEKT